MCRTGDQMMDDAGVELTAADVLTDEELAEDWRRGKSPFRLAYGSRRDEEPNEP